jgi:hypothetical protein
MRALLDRESEHHAGSADTWRDSLRLMAYSGPDKRLDEIKTRTWPGLSRDGSNIRSGARKRTRTATPVPTISPSTVNRSTTLRLKALFTRAKRTWRYSLPLEPNWQAHWLEEPEQRVRELHADDGAALDRAIRSDYESWLEFTRLTGLRLNDTLLRWANVNWADKTIITISKGGRNVATL